MTTAGREEPVPQGRKPEPKGGTNANRDSSSSQPKRPSRSHHTKPGIVVDAKAGILPLLTLSLLLFIKVLLTDFKRLLMFLMVVFIVAVSSLTAMVVLFRFTALLL